MDSLTTPVTGSAVNFKEIVEAIEGYTPPVEDCPAPAEVEPDGSGVREVLNSLVERILERDGYPEKCAYYMGRTTTGYLTYNFDGMFEQPIKVAASMPENIILFMPPGAVTLDGSTILVPRMITYAKVDWVVE